MRALRGCGSEDTHTRTHNKRFVDVEFMLTTWGDTQQAYVRGSHKAALLRETCGQRMEKHADKGRRIMLTKEGAAVYIYAKHTGAQA